MRELEKGDILKNLLYLSVPLLITNLMQNFFSIFDMFLLGKLGTGALSAISITGFVFSTFWSLTGGMMNAAQAVSSRYMGAKDYDRLKNTAANMIAAGYIMGITYVAVSFLFMDQILTFFGAKGETFIMAKTVFKISLISLINDSGLFVFFAILRAAGGIRKHFYLLVVSIVLNTVFEPVLIYGWLGIPAMGINGAPMARLFSYMVTTGIMVYILTQDKGVLQLTRKDLKIDPAFLLKFIRISIPASMQGITSNIASLVMLKIAAPYGDKLIAVLGIGSRLDVFVMMLGWAIGGSAAVMVGHNLGAGQPDRSEQTIVKGINFYSIFTFAAFALYSAFPAQVMGIFTKDPKVISYGIEYLRIISPFYLLLGVWIVSSAAFNGAGSTKTPMVINLIAFFLLQIPIAWALSSVPFFAERSIFISIATVFTFQGIAGYILFRGGRWKHKKI